MTKKEQILHELEMCDLEIRTAIETKNRLRKELDLLCDSCGRYLKTNEHDLCDHCLKIYQNELIEEILREELERENDKNFTYIMD